MGQETASANGTGVSVKGLSPELIGGTRSTSYNEPSWPFRAPMRYSDTARLDTPNTNGDERDKSYSSPEGTRRGSSTSDMSSLTSDELNFLRRISGEAVASIGDALNDRFDDEQAPKRRRLSSTDRRLQGTPQLSKQRSLGSLISPNRPSGPSRRCAMCVRHHTRCDMKQPRCSSCTQRGKGEFSIHGHAPLLIFHL